jgi:hypothetical protein
MATLRLLTQNVWFSKHKDAQRFSAQLSLFRDADPDIICLQEVNRAFLDTLRAAAHTTHPFLRAYEQDLPRLGLGSTYGVAMLVKAHLSPAFSRTPFEYSEMGRELLLARLHSAATGSISIGCVHLESMDSAPEREQQLAECRAKLDAAAGRGGAAVLAGDFNFCSLWDFNAMRLHLRGPQPPLPRFAFSPQAFALIGRGEEVPPWLLPGGGGAASPGAEGVGAGGGDGGGGAAAGAAAAAPPPAALLPPSPLVSSGGSGGGSGGGASGSAPAAFTSTENAAMEVILAGFTDAWPELHGPLSLTNASGFTFDSTRNTMLDNAELMRYDRVMFRLPGATLLRCELVGTEPLPPPTGSCAAGGGSSSSSSSSSGDVTPDRMGGGRPVFPSDHFGVLAEWRLPAPQA